MRWGGVPPQTSIQVSIVRKWRRIRRKPVRPHRYGTHTGSLTIIFQITAIIHEICFDLWGSPSPPQNEPERSYIPDFFAVVPSIYLLRMIPPNFPPYNGFYRYEIHRLPWRAPSPQERQFLTDSLACFWCWLAHRTTIECIVVSERLVGWMWLNTISVLKSRDLRVQSGDCTLRDYSVQALQTM